MVMNSKEYNKYVLERIRLLLRENRSNYYMDLHIHSNYSADGTQSVTDIMQRSRDIGLDIISITDHDSIEAYKVIMDNVSRLNDNSPIIIPGIEFSVSHDQYKQRCHVLKYFFDIDNAEFNKNLNKNNIAYWKRIEKQFELIHYNKALSYFFENSNVELTIEHYKEFLHYNDNKIPEYPTLMKYINEELLRNKISVWDVYQKTYEYIQQDPCKERKRLVNLALAKFYDKNKDLDISHNYSKLSRILAIVGVDDNDYPDYEPMGSLTVNQYGQVKMDELKNCGFQILAHPNNELLNYYYNYRDIICGLELNYRSTDEMNLRTSKMASQLDTVLTYGSDSHNLNDKFYMNEMFYRADHEILNKILREAEKANEV